MARAKVHRERMAAEMDGEFVVFLIGMRMNKPWKLHTWVPVARAMGRMLKELEADPALGYLGHHSFARMVVQYWRSFEHLEAYARSADHEHAPAMARFFRKVGAAG